MTVRIGFIGSEHSVERLRSTEELPAGIELRCYTYTDPLDTGAQYRAALAENDAVCFSGIIAHYHRRRELDSATPVLVGRFNDYVLVASLLSATVRNRVPIPLLSIDVPNPEIVPTVERDTGVLLSPGQVFDYRWVYESRFSRPVDIDALVDFHVARRERDGARLAITSVHAVHDRLQLAGVPVMFMVDAVQHEIDLLQAARQRVSVTRLKGSLLAAVYLTSSRGIAEESATAGRRARLSAILEGFATPVPHRLATWQQSGLDLFYTTRSELDARLPELTAALGGEAGRPVAVRAAAEHLTPARTASEIGVEDSVSLGAGIGRHIYEAEDRAMQALRRALAFPGDAAFLVDEETRVHGPLGGPATVETARHTEPWLNALAASASMQTRSVTRLLTFLGGRNFLPFTASEWAAASRTSPRTAERAVRKLLDAGAVVVVGQEQPLDAGRPRTVYALAAEFEARARALASHQL
ncbi:hypothetical protein [Leucobacter triazinivorans]|uniref:Uncharacterized protein n=1 Tax=Leucobacter triazinivorans TaxID=1784719 RepID=A0A4P6KI93_9MICO|nr:hypothetical protein [Leucobacter triazinivorans]QBE49708.1 hypothetical protein EVS81_13480 [Leucobacter triazinivorans]